MLQSRLKIIDVERNPTKCYFNHDMRDWTVEIAEEQCVDRVASPRASACSTTKSCAIWANTVQRGKSWKHGISLDTIDK